MKSLFFMVPLLIGIVTDCFAQIERNKVGSKVVKSETVLTPEQQVGPNYLKDTTIKIKITKKKLDSLRNAKIDLQDEASWHLQQYRITPSTTSIKTIEKVKFEGDIVVIFYSDGSEEKKRMGDYDDKSDNVDISYPKPPSDATLAGYTNSVNKTLETNIRKVLSDNDWREYLKMEEKLNVYGKIYRRIQLISFLSQKK